MFQDPSLRKEGMNLMGAKERQVEAKGVSEILF